jgi:asparagine synthase (glutamine-hydrolysing)
MCGVVGIVQMAGGLSKTDQDLVRGMRDTMISRGPDGAGLWGSSDGRAVFGHRRLSIIDLSMTASQPMATEDERVCLVFNGEIYNHRELRCELIAEGVTRWRTDHSDTEVVLRGFERHGVEFVHRLRGMFAFAVWDSRQRELVLARDRVGIKPLYFYEAGGRIVFASEIKAIVKDGRVPRRLNEEALVHYLTFLVSPAPDTMFQGVHKLAAGTVMRFSADGERSVIKYWEPLEKARWSAASRYADVVTEAASLIEDAVRVKSIADVPVGIFLSGGIDSSTNAVLFAKQNGSEAVRTFSIAYDEKSSRGYPSEIGYARAVADLVGARNDVRILTERDVMEFIPRMIELQDEPIGDPVCAPVFFVSQLARDHGIKVCQVGEGADELFFGYPIWQLKLRVQSALSTAESVGGPLVRQAARVAGWLGSARPQGEALRRFGNGFPVFWGGADAFTDAEKSVLLGPAVRTAHHDVTWGTIKPLYDEFRRSPAKDDMGRWMTYVDLKIRLPELLLMRVDKMSMGVSVEARVPFLDHPLVEWALGLPTSMRIRDGRLKAILKDAMRGRLPDEILNRPKQGFGVPVHDWVNGNFGRRASDEVTAFAKRTGVLSEKGVRSVISKGRGAKLWYLLNLALWHERWIEGRDVLALAS